MFLATSGRREVSVGYLVPPVNILSVGSQSVCVLPRKIHVSVSALFRFVCVFVGASVRTLVCENTGTRDTKVEEVIVGHFISGAHEINKAETLDRS